MFNAKSHRHAHAISLIAAIVTLCLPGPATAQSAGGAKGFLYRAAAAVLGQPAKNTQTTAIHNQAGADIPGTMGAGQAITDGPVYRPLSPTHGQFPGIFDGFSVSESVRRGHYPRVALTFETYGATLACWKVHATIWQSARNHHDERFELCDAPLTARDDLGQPMVIGDPTLPLSSVIQSRHILPAPGLSVTDERTTGPTPPRSPFNVNIGSTKPNAGLLLFQYKAIVARAMVISGYASKSDVSGGNSMFSAPTAGSAGQLLWVAGFAPGGDQDH
jgi:hypothetical protein